MYNWQTSLERKLKIVPRPVRYSIWSPVLLLNAAWKIVKLRKTLQLLLIQAGVPPLRDQSLLEIQWLIGKVCLQRSAMILCILCLKVWVLKKVSIPAFTLWRSIPALINVRALKEKPVRTLKPSSLCYIKSSWSKLIRWNLKLTQAREKY